MCQDYTLKLWDIQKQWCEDRWKWGRYSGESVMSGLTSSQKIGVLRKYQLISGFSRCVKRDYDSHRNMTTSYLGCLVIFAFHQTLNNENITLQHQLRMKETFYGHAGAITMLCWSSLSLVGCFGCGLLTWRNKCVKATLSAGSFHSALQGDPTWGLVSQVVQSWGGNEQRFGFGSRLCCDLPLMIPS